MTKSSNRQRDPLWRRLPAIVVVCIFGVAFLVLAPVGRADADAFVAGVEDLPLMPGLAEVRDAGVVFDKPGGRIVEAYAEGSVGRSEVIGFYQQTLPQLGWRALGDTTYQREGERLEIVILGGDGDLVVRFTLQPN
ncbi:MAG: hypothetical protein ACTSW2_04835 [Alphaproteobacteria bacterium]